MFIELGYTHLILCLTKYYNKLKYFLSIRNLVYMICEKDTSQFFNLHKSVHKI